jgi:hypothetical protein
MGPAKQVNVRFEGEALKQLQELEATTGKSLSQVLREAVNTSHWVHTQQRKGKKILLQEDENEDRLREVIFR